MLTFAPKCNIIVLKGVDNMFDQQKYINSFIKENYKTIKLRIRNDDRLIIDKINNVNNINKYIKELIYNDIINNRKYNFINDAIKVEFDLSPTLRDLINRAEEADLYNDYGLYMNIVDAIDSQAKKEVTNHFISETEWNRLLRRYTL